MDTGAEYTPEQWGQRYQAERDVYIDFTNALYALIPQLLDQASIPYAQIECRTKEVAHFVAKLKRKGDKYKDNPLREVTDLVGLRIVLFYLDDVERVGEMIEQEFAVDPKHSGDKSAMLDPDRFGYLSVHHVARLSPTRISLPEWSTYGEIHVEFQVRTVLQHAWAAVSRKLAYANVRDAPRKLRRNLNRLSALFELADDEFLAIRKAREEIEAQHQREVERGKFEADALRYLEKSGAQERIECIAREAGSATEASKEDEYAKNQHGFQRNLLAAIDRAGLETVSDLEKKLDALWSVIPAFMRAVNASYFDADGQPISTEPRNWLCLIFLWSIKAPAEDFEELGYVEALVDVVRSTYDGGPT